MSNEVMHPMSRSDYVMHLGIEHSTFGCQKLLIFFFLPYHTVSLFIHNCSVHWLNAYPMTPFGLWLISCFLSLIYPPCWQSTPDCHLTSGLTPPQAVWLSCSSSWVDGSHSHPKGPFHWQHLAGVLSLQDLIPDDLRWSWCNNNRNKVHSKGNAVESSPNHPYPGPWKNRLPWNWSLVPERLGTTALEYPQSVTSVCACKVQLETWMRWLWGVRMCVCPSRAEELAAAHSDSWGLDRQAGRIHQQTVSFSQEECVFSVEYIQTVSFFFFEQQIMGGWEGKEMEGKGEREGLLFLKLCQALVLWKFLWGRKKGREDGRE